MVPPRHKLQRKWQKNIYDYSHYSIDDIQLIIVNSSRKLIDQENSSVMNYFGYFTQYHCIETNTKSILTHVLKSWNENKSIAHPSICTFSPAENIALKIYLI